MPTEPPEGAQAGDGIDGDPRRGVGGFVLFCFVFGLTVLGFLGLVFSAFGFRFFF